MNDMDNIMNKLKEHEKRLDSIERELGVRHDRSVVMNRFAESQEDIPEPQEIKHPVHKKQSKIEVPNFSFTQVITFLGVLGIIIGIISFFFYAVANHWIGESLQVLIGVVIGAVLFGLAYNLHEKNENWSMFVFGGSLLVEFISIGVGVLEYEVLPKVLGLFILLLFIGVSTVLSVRFQSRIIAYYTLVGGFLIPIISGLYDNELFIIVYLLLLSFGLAILSAKYNWADLRFVSWIVQTLYIASNMRMLTNDNYLAMSLIFLILNFLIYNFSAMFFSVKGKKEINQLDSIMMNFNSVFFLVFSYAVLEDILSMMEFGIYVLPFAFLYLIEIYVLKSNSQTEFKSTYYSVFSSAIITLNLAIYFILEYVNVDFFIVLFAIEWIMFSILSKRVDESNYFKIVSYLFFALFALWYAFVLRFDLGMTHATMYMLFLIAVIPVLYMLVKKDIDFNFNGPVLLIYVFAVIYSFAQYLYFLEFTSKAMSLSLSVMWLVYTLVELKMVGQNKKARILMMILLGITLLKIAFVDLLFLQGVYRIVGFTLFGVLLLIGGYFLKNESSN